MNWLVGIKEIVGRIHDLILARSARECSVVRNKYFDSRKYSNRIDICVSGGTSITPILKYFFCCYPFYVNRLVLSLTDERLGSCHSQSNFHSTRDALPPGVRIQSPCNTALGNSKYALSVIGMGDDGHIASIFQNEFSLRPIVRSTSVRKCFVTSKSHGQPPSKRYSMNLAQLCHTDHVLLILNTPEKLAIFDRNYSDHKTPLGSFYRETKDRIVVCESYRQ